jgi:hypothetical protein
MVKGRVPRTKDFQMIFRDNWGAPAQQVRGAGPTTRGRRPRAGLAPARSWSPLYPCTQPTQPTQPASNQHQAVIKAAQAKILSAMPALVPLLPIKMSLGELTPHCVINIAPIVVAQFLDGRSGMSYGFLAYQLPTGPVEKCNKVTVLVTRSGCDKQNPHPDDDWILLSFDPDRISLEISRALGGWRLLGGFLWS